MRNLWGRDFAIVPDGLAEEDVSAYVQELRSQREESEERLANIDSLHELATRTLREAQALAEDIREETRKEAEESADQIISQATDRAQQIIEAAEEAKTESERESASAILLAEKKANELILGAQASAERRLTDAGSQTLVSTAEAEQSDAWANRTSNDQPGRDTKYDRPQASQPSTGKGPEGESRPVFRWSPVPGATRYGLYVVGPPYGRDDHVYVREDITETSLTLPISLNEGITYKWTIRAGNDKGWGKPSPFQRFPS